MTNSNVDNLLNHSMEHLAKSDFANAAKLHWIQKTLTPTIYINNGACRYRRWVLSAGKTDDRNSYLFGAIAVTSRKAPAFLRGLL
jgi:hypothetical protein